MKRSFIKTEYLIAILLLMFCGLMLAVGTVQAHYVNETAWIGTLDPPNGDSEYLTVGKQHFVLPDIQTNGETQISKTLVIPIHAGNHAMSGLIGCYTRAKDELAILSSAISGDKITQGEDGQYLTLAADESCELTLTLRTIDTSVPEPLPVTATVWWLADFSGTQQLLQADFTLWLLPPDEGEPILFPEKEPTEPEEPVEPEEPAEPEEPEEPEQPTEQEEPVEPEQPTEPDTQQSDEPKRSTGKRSVQPVSVPTTRFAADGPLPLLLSLPEGTESLLLEFTSGEDGSRFPAGTRYSTDLGETVYRLYEADRIRVLPPDDSESFWLLLDFSESELVLPEDRQITLFFAAVSGENMLMTQELTAEAANQMPHPVTDTLHVINETDALELTLTGEWGTGLWDPVIERLTQSEETGLFEFTEIDNVEYRFVFEQADGVLSLKTAERDTPAGTYRLLLKLQFGDVTVFSTETPFFVIYDSINENPIT